MGMVQYRVTTKFSIGIDNDTTEAFNKDEIVLFDGTFAEYRGERKALDKLKAAIRAEWLVPVGSSQVYKAPSAPIKVSAATDQQKDRISDGVSHVTDDERVVISVGERQDSQNAGQFTIQNMEGNDQGGTDVGIRFKTSSKSSLDLSKLSSQDFHKVINAAERPVARVGTGTGTVLVENDEDLATALGEFEEPQTTAVVEDSAEPLDDLLDPATREGRYLIAKIIHPELPEWDFSEHWTKKIDKLLTEYGENELVIRAVYAAESDAIKKRLRSQFEFLV